jgi:DNA (cytosine-5)-methyltransferase 1
MLTFGSLFAGIGGIDLGLERAGMRCAWQVEIDDYATRILAKHWPDVPRFRDVRRVGAHNLPRVDMLAGGFPCQGISDAGQREGFDEPRSGLWREFSRIIHELRPRYVLVENVAALLDRGIDRVLGELATLGYDAEWSVLSSCALGASHTRERLFIVAYTNGQHGQAGMGHFTQFGATALSSRNPTPSPRQRLGATPGIPRGADEFPYRMERTQRLGNAVDPNVAEFIGRCIMESLR